MLVVIALTFIKRFSAPGSEIHDVELMFCSIGIAHLWRAPIFSEMYLFVWIYDDELLSPFLVEDIPISPSFGKFLRLLFLVNVTVIFSEI